MNSRSKGARGEREAAREWALVLGGETRRGQQFHGGTDSPDIVTSHSNVHVEVKRTERGNPYSWIDQAVADCEGKVPVVMHRRNNREWLLIVRFSDAKRLAAEIAGEAESLGHGQVPCPVPGEGVPPAAKATGE